MSLEIRRSRRLTCRIIVWANAYVNILFTETGASLTVKTRRSVLDCIKFVVSVSCPCGNIFEATKYKYFMFMKEIWTTEWISEILSLNGNQSQMKQIT
jgi:hypothetical protein